MNVEEDEKEGSGRGSGRGTKHLREIRVLVIHALINYKIVNLNRNAYRAVKKHNNNKNN